MPHLLIFGLILYLIFILPAFAQANDLPSPEKAKDYLTEILKQPEFQTTREKYYWRYIGETSPPKETETPESIVSFQFGSVIAQFFEILLWLLLSVGVIILVIYAFRWLEQFQAPKISMPQSTVAKQPILKIKSTPMPLPQDISQQAWLLWQSGEMTAAISMLYRGALVVLKTRDGLFIEDSTTEKECLQQVLAKQSVELFNYFSKLTRTWQNIAYAQRQPQTEEAQYLCQGWAQYFESS